MHGQQGSGVVAMCSPAMHLTTSCWLSRVQVLPVELPGHGSRMKEPRVTNLCQLSQQAVAALEPHIR
jgi:surfactin synthase thioesterase subunit